VAKRVLHNLVTSYRFKVIFEGGQQSNKGNQEISFRRVSGLKLSRGFEPLVVGGKNDGPVFLPVPVKELTRTTLERGRVSKSVLKDLEPSTCFASVDIQMLSEKGEVTAVYRTQTAVVESWETSELDALNGEVLIEKYTILHTGFQQQQ
jgi:phage tail-like protein